MNYLAHLYLSGNHNEIKVGNFIADDVKGKMINRYSVEIQNGILLHRKIDAYTDSHPLVKEGILRLRANHGKFAGVVIDMFYDHFLAANWSTFSEKKLEDFTSESYMLLLRHFFKLPPRTRILLPFILKSDWLASYRDLNFLSKAFRGLSYRTTYETNMKSAVDDLSANYSDYKSEFLEFFPDMISYAEKERNHLVLV